MQEIIIVLPDGENCRLPAIEQGGKLYLELTGEVQTLLQKLGYQVCGNNNKWSLAKCFV